MCRVRTCVGIVGILGLSVAVIGSSPPHSETHEQPPARTAHREKPVFLSLGLFDDRLPGIHLCATGAGTAQGPEPAIAERPYVGFRACLRCHNTGVEGNAVELPGGIKLDLKDDAWVLYKEFPIWAKEDKHGQAYAVLLNERSKRMGKLLGIAEVHRDKRCLACHSGFPLGQMALEKDDLISAELAKNLDVNLGVSCEGCHGPGGDLRREEKIVLKGWRAPHEIQPLPPYEKTQPWRFLSPETKNKEYGFWDVRSPASRTQICASCHIGNVEHGRIVTHEMYAAGHPPLPSFEVETFTQQMPKHWRDFPTKSDKVIAEFLQHTKDPLYADKVYKKDNLHRSRSLLVGALASLSEYVKLLGQLANDQVKSPVKRPEWPELAAFDCYACHHDLQNPAWRQARKPPVGTPGRPPLAEWNAVLVRTALKTAPTTDADYDATLKAVRQAINSQPFGNREEIRKSAPVAASRLWSMAEELQRRPVTRNDGLGLLKEIVTVASSETLDYESARQCVWAVRVIDGEVKSPNSARIQAIVETLEKDMFLLNLRSGRKAAATIPGEKQERATVEVDLQTVLPFIANYDPLRFQGRFKEIGALLK